MTFCEIPGCGQRATYEIGWSLRCSQHKNTSLAGAPQAQEETPGAPAPGGMCPHCLHNMELVARTAERIKYLEEVERKFEAHVCPAPETPIEAAGVKYGPDTYGETEDEIAPGTPIEKAAREYVRIFRRYDASLAKPEADMGTELGYALATKEAWANLCTAVDGASLSSLPQEGAAGEGGAG